MAIKIKPSPLAVNATLLLILGSLAWACSSEDDALHSEQEHGGEHGGEVTPSESQFLPSWRAGSSHQECLDDGSDVEDPNQPGLTVSEWVQHTQGLVYGEIIAVEPVSDRFTRFDLNDSLDDSAQCLESDFEHRLIGDLILRPVLAAGDVVEAESVRIRVSEETQQNWEARLLYQDGALVSAEGDYVIELGDMIGARLHDLGLDGAESVYSTLGTSFFSFDEADSMRFQFESQADLDAYECGGWTEADFIRETDDVRPGIRFDEFEALVGSLSAEMFNHPFDALESRGRASAGSNMFRALTPETRDESDILTGLYNLLTSSSCYPVGWSRAGGGETGDTLPDRDDE